MCGDPNPGVHHREPGKSVLHLMIALCAGCHAKVHRTKVVLTEFPPLLLVLWREQYPEGHEQTYLDFNVRKPPAQSVLQSLDVEMTIEIVEGWASKQIRKRAEADNVEPRYRRPTQPPQNSQMVRRVDLRGCTARD